MNTFGQFGELLVCLSAVLSAAGGALMLGGNGRAVFSIAGGRAFQGAAFAGTAALAALTFSLLTHDYRLAYVHDYADQSMGVGYLITAIWGGREGSLLLWAVLQSWFTVAAALWATGDDRIGDLAPVGLGALGGIGSFFYLLVLFQSNPFEILGTTATAGIGMNPLLRNPYMAIHPPTLYVGFVGFSVPAAFALAALAEGRSDRGWIVALRGWVLWAWGFLGVGNLLGMIWAYQELGWGGYWGWDPVENASFIPWLTGTALVHAVMGVERRRGFAFFSVVLMVATYILVIFGTFLTRSGIIESVHAFAGATAGPYFLGLIVLLTGMTVALLAWRRGSLPGSPDDDDGELSRSFVFAVTTWTFVAAAAFVWGGTMWPFFQELFVGEQVAVLPEFFNRWMVPIGLAILVLMGACVVIPWRGLSALTGRRRILAVIGIGVAVGAASRGLGGASIQAALAIGVITAVGLVTAGEVVSGARGKASLRQLGGRLVHVAVVLMFVGFTGNAFNQESSALVRPGQTIRVGDYSIRFLGLRNDNDFTRTALYADLDVRRGGQPLGVLSPARFGYHSHPGNPTSEVVIRTGATEDLFLILGEADPTSGVAMIRAVVNPMVVWIWLGGLLMVVGTLVSAYRRGLPERAAILLSLNRVPLAVLGVGAAVLVALGAVEGLAFALLALVSVVLGLLVWSVGLGAIVLAGGER